MKCWVKLIVVLAVTVLAVEADAKQNRRRKVFGEVTKVDAKAVTISLDGDKGPATFALDTKTGVMIETDEDEEIKGPDGRITMRQPKQKRGTLADLKTGQRLSVVSYDQKTASHIVVKRPKKKEGDKK
jgi:hypothetical protein